MKILVVGVGSIGHKHAINAANLCETSIVDADASKAEKVAQQTGSRSFGSDLETALKNRFDAVIIAVPHKDHITVAEKAVKSGADVLIEKPLSHNYDEAEKFIEYAKSVGRKVFVVCNMRFHPAVQCLKQYLPEIGKPLFSRAHYGNYLPDMRPGVDYRSLYVADKEQGGVLLDGIHELDYLSWFFGSIDWLFADSGHISELDIEADDYAGIILKHQSGVRSEVHLDYCRRIKRRGCEISGTDGVLHWSSEGKSPEHCIVRLYKEESGWENLLSIQNVNNLAPLKNMMETFVSGLKQGNHFLQTGEEALILLKATLAARNSNDLAHTI